VKGPRFGVKLETKFFWYEPWKLFERRLRITKLESLCPIHEGMLPTNSFSAISMVTKSLQFFKEDGNFPENLLLYRCKYERESKIQWMLEYYQ
jgi:hypothetical protein